MNGLVCSMNGAKKVFSVLIVIAIVGILLISVAPTTAAGDIYPKDDMNANVAQIVGGSDEFPSSLDLRDQGLVTSVKNQGSNGTCWAFAAISCMETSLINKGYADNSIDLSELHMAYFSVNTTSDPLGGLDGDTVLAEYNFRNCGSNGVHSGIELAKWAGAALESEFPYEWISQKDLDISDREYDSSSYTVTDVAWVNPEDTNTIKTILNGGDSLVFSFYVDWNSFNMIDNGDGTHTTTYYYNAGDILSNHEVTLIGYDDDYPAENFKDTPPGNGAWLIKNSWGTTSKCTSSDGCNWISYYNVGNDMMTSFNAEPSSTYDNNYQYDGGWSTCQNVTRGTTGYMANLFTAAGDEDLKAVSFYNMDNINVGYEIQIYLNPADPKDPTTGTAMFGMPQSGVQIYSGYHTVTLDQSVKLNKGDVFAVVIKLTASEDVYMPVDTSVRIMDASMSEGSWGISVTRASSGQSLISANGSEWEDLSSDGTSNLRIKAFTTDIEKNDSNDNVPVFIAVGLAVALVVAVFAVAVYAKKQ